jgi:outer membrane autotransporter protein
VLNAVTSTGNFPATGAAVAFDGIIDVFIANGSSGNTDMDTVINALGRFSTYQQVSDAVAETLPLLVSGTTQIATGTLRSTNRVIQARQSGFSGMSSGDGFFTDKHLWVKPVGSWTTQDERNGVAGYRADSYGLVGGIDSELGTHTRLGFALSYMNSDVDGRGSASGNKVDIDAYQAIFYGSRSLQNHPDIEVNWQADIGINKNQGRRHISFMNRTAKADYDSYTAHIGIGAGKRFELNDTTTIIPSLRADYAYIKDESYTETGAGSLNLDIDSNHVDELIVMAQGHLSHQLNDSTSLTANAGLGYDFINDTASLTASYTGGGVAFTTKGFDPNPWLARAGVGVNYQLSDSSEITASYDLEGREDFLNQTASVKFRWMF